MGFPRKVDAYIMREFAGPFAFCVVGFTIILISGLLFELTDLIFVKSVPVETVGRMLLYKIPEMVVLTLPIAVLFGTLVSLGRLVQDSEMKVLRSSGLSFPRLMLPVCLLGFVVSGITYWAAEEVVPEANHKYENTLRRIVFTEGIPLIEENVFFYGGENRYFYIGEVDSETHELSHILVYELGQGAFPRLITAKRGSFVDNLWVLYDGIVQEMDEEGFVTHETRFGQMEIVTDQNADLFLGNQRTTNEMNRRELKQHIERFQRSGLRVLSFVVDLPHEAGHAHVVVHFRPVCCSFNPLQPGGPFFWRGCEFGCNFHVLRGHVGGEVSGGKWGPSSDYRCLAGQFAFCPGRVGLTDPRRPAEVKAGKEHSDAPNMVNNRFCAGYPVGIGCGGNAEAQDTVRISAAPPGWYHVEEQLFVGG